MDTNEFDKAVVAAVFGQAGLVGWRPVSLVGAAQDAGLDLARLRARFPNKTAVLLRFGVIADQEVLAAAPATGTPRDKLFDLVMARFDVLQTHRAGVLALIDALRTDPALGGLLWSATGRSMRWLLDAAGVPTGGVVGALRVNGMGLVWGYALRAWEKDESADLSATMAAVDRALDRAMQAENMVPGRRPAPADPSPPYPSPPSALPLLPGDEVADAPGGPAVL
jgi:hypothetical protein